MGIKGDWKPRVEYQTLKDDHRPILVRGPSGCGPMIVIWKDGHFYPCPGAPIFYGSNQCGWWVNDNFAEWMELPE